MEIESRIENRIKKVTNHRLIEYGVACREQRVKRQMKRWCVQGFDRGGADRGAVEETPVLQLSSKFSTEYSKG